MTISELAGFIRANKPGLNYPGVHPTEDASLVLQQTRHELGEYKHITDEHVFECCLSANTFDEHIQLCLPIAKSDTATFRYISNRPAPRGRTKRRFR
jgi:hypothetical protein